jgi:acetoin utilization protein AcuB
MYAHEPVNRYMTEAVLSVDLQSPAGEVLRLFAGYPVHHLPVVDNNKIVGMLGISDFFRLKGFLPKLGSAPLEYLNQHVRIEQIMHRPAITIRPQHSIEAAAALMAKHGIHALPVTDEEEHLLGIITTTDIIFAALHLDLRAHGPDQGGGQPDSSPGQAAQEEPPLGPGALEEAMRLAAANSARDDELGQLSRALLHQRGQIKRLEAVRFCAQRYLTAGQDGRLHALLTQALAQAQESAGPPQASQ